MNFKELLSKAVANQASDIHLISGQPPLLRIHGAICNTDLPCLESQQIRTMFNEVMTHEQQQLFQDSLELDFAFAIEGVSRVRANVFTSLTGISAVLRIIPSVIPSLSQIKAPEIFRQIAKYNNGLVLVTGPTGCGKSTTLAAILDYINENCRGHILTIEDPIEFIHHNKLSIINQRELATHTKSFGQALKSALREDPDCILVGEMRDLDTIRLALTAAETGHLVFATLHTTSATKAIDRIIDVFPAGEKDMVRTMLSESLRAVIAQQLIANQDDSARVAAARVAVHEIMIVNTAIKNLIRENKIAQINSVLQTGSQSGMQTFDQGLIAAVKNHQLSAEIAANYASHKGLFAN